MCAPGDATEAIVGVRKRTCCWWCCPFVAGCALLSTGRSVGRLMNWMAMYYKRKTLHTINSDSPYGQREFTDWPFGRE